MAFPDDRLSIDTPENVTFGYRVAGIGSRFLAALVDSLLIVALQAVVILLVILVSALVLSIEGSSLSDFVESENSAMAWLAAGLGLLAFAFFWGYYIFFELLWNGQSPGKRWVGLRVIRADGAPITLAESIIRNLIRLVDFLPAYYGIGVVTMFVNSQSRRLGDLAAGTVVVYDKAAISLASLASQPTVAQTPSTFGESQLPVERLTSQDMEMAEDFIRRRDQLTNRATLAPRLAQALAQRMSLPESAFDAQQAENLIVEVVRVSHGRSES
jgi:uncharacterized RDD family membrane protein YckC